MVRFSIKLIGIVLSPQFVSAGQDCSGDFSRSSDPVGCRGMDSVWGKVGLGRGVSAIEEAFNERSEVAMGGDCGWDESHVVLDDGSNNFVS